MPSSDTSISHAVFGLRTPNLGDDLQALTVAMTTPRVTRLLSREWIGWRQARDPQLLVMNYWFMSNGFWWPPHSTIRPVFHGFCVGRDELMKYGWPRYLKQHEPIGCRDTRSVALLKERGIDAYWSGCITLFLGRTVTPVAAAERSGVYLVDVPPEAERLIPADIRARAVRLTNKCPRSEIGDPIARWARIAAITDKLRHAELVVTRRLHTALPAAGFGTPVVLLVHNKPQDVRRFSGYESFLPVVIHENGRALSDAPWPDVRTPVIPAELVRHFETLKGRLTRELGPLPSARSATIASRVRLRIPNPGLGGKPGDIRIDLGSRKISRTPLAWNDREIVAEFDAFNGFERFDAPVEVRSSSSLRTAGLVHELAEPSATSTGSATLAGRDA